MLVVPAAAWLAWIYVPFVTFVLTGVSNAVNLTDGLDGLAAGLTAVAALTFALFAYVIGRVDTSTYLQIYYLRGAGELAVFCSAIFGATLGFLWFNAHPAQVFMGDTGSLALGGALGAIAILLKSEFLLLLIGGVFVAETMSVIVQRTVFKYRRRRYGLEYAQTHRVFRRAPLHHHFELLGLAGDHGGRAILDPGDSLRHCGAQHPQAAVSRDETQRRRDRRHRPGRERPRCRDVAGSRGACRLRVGWRIGAGVRAMAEVLAAAGVAVNGRHDLARIARASLVVASPGVPAQCAATGRGARRRACPIVSEVEMALARLPGVRYIAVTGTNGKTTTTALIAHLLRAIGRRGGGGRQHRDAAGRDRADGSAAGVGGARAVVLPTARHPERATRRWVC